VIRYWLPPILWMAVIFLFSTDLFSARQTGSGLSELFSLLDLSLDPETIRIIDLALRKVAHLSAYAILAWLVYRALRRGGQPAWSLKRALAAFVVSALYAITDEVHQSFTIERSGAAMDVFIDWCGSLAGLLILSVRGGGISRGR
jgi:VanZ family protein